jgi:iron(II)-dependent oxidoreductase
MTRRLIAEDRYVFVLLKEAVADIAESDAQPAWKVIADQMALIPAGAVPVLLGNGAMESVEVPSYYLDRCSVTNRQFQRFVQAAGYDNLELWPQEIWPGLMRLTDRTGRPGPRGWENGQYPPGKGDHPVVGVSWYEALAYARWVGKRLPRSAEWQKAGGWPEHISGGSCTRYPWGDVFDPTRANLWATGKLETVPVRDFPTGATPNGIYQMTGNVWEWLDEPLDTIPGDPEETFEAWKPLRRIVGGAFDTYFANEAICQFVTGQPELDRRDNIGFRCALSADRLRPYPDRLNLASPER